jgi:membrane protease YdiL (CAAX protease family)
VIIDTGILPRKILHLVIGYIVFVLLCGAALNFFAANTANIPGLMAAGILLWCGLYVPLVVLPSFANWQIAEFGLLLNYRLAVTLLILLLVLFLRRLPIASAFNTISLIEGLARTGEEIFFRGFLIALLLRIYREKRHPWIWAAVFSSLAFALVHTHRYLLDGPSFSAVWNIFFAGLLLAFIRLWTGSVLPGALLHSGVNSDISAA